MLPVFENPNLQNKIEQQRSQPVEQLKSKAPARAEEEELLIVRKRREARERIEREE